MDYFFFSLDIGSPGPKLAVENSRSFQPATPSVSEPPPVVLGLQQQRSNRDDSMRSLPGVGGFGGEPRIGAPRRWAAGGWASPHHSQVRWTGRRGSRSDK